MTAAARPDAHTASSDGSAARAGAREYAAWEGAALGHLEWVACPALAGAAFCLLALGAVTWLPALAALAAALHRWRRDGDTRCFTGVLAAFPACWRALWRPALPATAAPAAVLVAMAFLAGRPEPVAVPLLAVQLGGLAAFAVYHLALAVVVGRDPAARAARRDCALALGFGSPRRCLVLLAALVLAPVLSLPLAVGPLLFGASLPVLCALALQDHVEAAR